MRIQLSDDRRARLAEAVQRYYANEFDDPLSAFRAQGLIEFFLAELGPAVYNQGVRDACAAMQDKLGDLEGEVYEVDRSERQ